MASRRQRQLQQTLTALEAAYGPGIVRRARDLKRPRPPHLATGFPQLDALTGCGGVPLGYMTLLSGRATAGKFTLACTTLAAAQTRRPHQTVALLDLARSADPDYLARAGVDLNRLLLVRPPLDPTAVDILGDLSATRHLRLIVVNSLADLQTPTRLYRRLTAMLPRLQRSLRANACALLWLDEPSPPWLRWFNLDRSGVIRQAAALHLALRWEAWLDQPYGELCGYRAQAHLHASRWARPRRSVPVEIIFNGAIQARPTW